MIEDIFLTLNKVSKTNNVARLWFHSSKICRPIISVFDIPAVELSQSIFPIRHNLKFWILYLILHSFNRLGREWVTGHYITAINQLLLLLVHTFVKLAKNIWEQWIIWTDVQQNAMSLTIQPFRFICLTRWLRVTFLDSWRNSSWRMCCEEIYSAISPTIGAVIYCAERMEQVTCWDCVTFKLCRDTCLTDEQEESTAQVRRNE